MGCEGIILILHKCVLYITVASLFELFFMPCLGILGQAGPVSNRLPATEEVCVRQQLCVVVHYPLPLKHSPSLQSLRLRKEMRTFRRDSKLSEVSSNLSTALDSSPPPPNFFSCST